MQELAINKHTTICIKMTKFSNVFSAKKYLHLFIAKWWGVDRGGRSARWGGRGEVDKILSVFLSWIRVILNRGETKIFFTNLFIISFLKPSFCIHKTLVLARILASITRIAGLILKTYLKHKGFINLGFIFLLFHLISWWSYRK